MATYGGFAGVYDRLMDDFDYDCWADYYLKAIAETGITPKNVCDCACGTGSMSNALAKRGLKVTGVDISPEMLEIAAEKARAEALKIMFVKQDMCRLTLPRTVDAVICACDGVNYLKTFSRVRAFLTAAHAALRQGGCLAFDISSRYKLEHVIGDAFFGEERDDVAYLWSNHFDKEDKTAKMDVTFFIRTESGLYERVNETHVQRAHDVNEITDALQECGFRGIKVYGDRTFRAPGENEQRIHFFATRAENGV